jgi:Protein of unknown function (DUF3297)
MTDTHPDTLPDRLSNNPRSPFFKEDVLKRDIGVRFNGAEKSNVEEYCVSEGWIRVEVGKTKDRYGNPMTIRLNGKVEPYFKDKKTEPPAEPEAEQRPATGEKAAKAEQSPKADKPAKSEKTERGAKGGKAKPGKPDTKPEKTGTKKKKK